jgi:hypothetical protein
MPLDCFSIIPAGPFVMGDTLNEGNHDEQPVHEVYVDAFYMSKNPVTYGEWKSVLDWAVLCGYVFDCPGMGHFSCLAPFYHFPIFLLWLEIDRKTGAERGKISLHAPFLCLFVLFFHRKGSISIEIFSHLCYLYNFKMTQSAEVGPGKPF